MCLGVPGKVVAVDEWGATVDCWGVRRQVRLDLLDAPVVLGEYIVSHLGVAIRPASAALCQTCRSEAAGTPTPA